MPRIARVVIPGLTHHITQRGNYGINIFHDDKDRIEYLSRINEYCQKFGVSVLCYCLMSNHVHFIVIPPEENTLARIFHTAHMRYTQYFNKRKGDRGHLWQGRFYSYVLDEGHLIEAARYIERNPVKAKIVKKPWQWKWSSVQEHIGLQNSSFIELENLFNYIGMKKEKWREFISDSQKETTMTTIDQHLSTGRPLGNKRFITRLEKRLDKRLHALPWGRPRI